MNLGRRSVKISKRKMRKIPVAMQLCNILLFACALTTSALAGNGRCHQDATTNAMENAGFSSTAITIVVIGNLKTDVYSSMPKPLQVVTRGPWSCETDPFHFDDLFTGKDVSDYWKNLETTGKKAIQEVIKEIQEKGLNAERKKKLLKLMGVLLHAVQDFYYHSNWVEQWDAAGKGGDIPTYDEAQKIGDAQAQNILNNTHTGSYKAKEAPEGSQTHDELNKDAPNSEQGKKTGKDQKTTYHEMANRVAEKATEEWLKKFENWVGDAELWNKIKKCEGIDDTEAKAMSSELKELQEMITKAGHWAENKPLDILALAGAYLAWKNRCASLSNVIFRELLKDFSDTSPAKKYLGMAPTPQRDEFASLEGVVVEVEEVARAVKQIPTRTLPKPARNSLDQARSRLDLATAALKRGDVNEAYSMGVMALQLLGAAHSVAPRALPEARALQDAGLRLQPLVERIGNTPEDFEVWLPSNVRADESFSGLVLAKTPRGYEPYDGEITVNGAVTPVQRGKFDVQALKTVGTFLIGVGILSKAAGDRDRYVKPVKIRPYPAPADEPLIANVSDIIHPRAPVMVVSGSNLDKIKHGFLQDNIGKRLPIGTEVGSSFERLALTEGIPPGEYTYIGETEDGKRYEAPTGTEGPEFSISAPLQLKVGERGTIEVRTTSRTPVPINLVGGLPTLKIDNTFGYASADLPFQTPCQGIAPGPYRISAHPELIIHKDEYVAQLLNLRAVQLNTSMLTKLLEGVMLLPGDLPDSKKEQEKKKWEERAKKLEEEAEKLEEEAKKDEEKGRNKDTRKKRKEAGDKRSKAAEARRRAGDSSGAAENEEKAAENYRKEAEQSSSGTPRSEAARRAAAAEQRAAKDKLKEADKALKEGEKGKAAGKMREAAEAYDRAAKDYKDIGAGSDARKMENTADNLRKQADRLDK